MTFVVDKSAFCGRIGSRGSRLRIYSLMSLGTFGHLFVSSVQCIALASSHDLMADSLASTPLKPFALLHLSS